VVGEALECLGELLDDGRQPDPLLAGHCLARAVAVASAQEAPQGAVQDAKVVPEA
jgi:hypothetical protein